MKIIADRDIPFLQGVLEPFAEIVYMRGDEIRAADDRDAITIQPSVGGEDTEEGENTG